MIRIPAPYLRGATVLVVGATFVLGHAAFAAPQAGTKAEAPMQMAAADSHEGEDRL